MRTYTHTDMAGVRLCLTTRSDSRTHTHMQSGPGPARNQRTSRRSQRPLTHVRRRCGVCVCVAHHAKCHTSLPSPFRPFGGRPPNPHPSVGHSIIPCGVLAWCRRHMKPSITSATVITPIEPASAAGGGRGVPFVACPPRCWGWLSMCVCVLGECVCIKSSTRAFVHK